MNTGAKAFLAIILLAIGVGLGIFFGKDLGKTQAEAELRPALQAVFPVPASDIRIVTGFVRGIYGGTINLEISDPNDYLPHADGSATKKQLRFVGVGSATKISLADISNVDRSGNIVRTTIALSAVKTGDAITVRSAENIKDLESFDASEIEVVRY